MKKRHEKSAMKKRHEFGAVNFSASD